jgi:membrane-associated phospholipid phosphatase
VDAVNATRVTFARSSARVKENLSAGETARPSWWPLLSTAPYWAWLGFCAHRRRARWEQVAVAVGLTALACGGARSRRVFQAVAPLGAVGLLYDAMRLVKNVGLREDNVHLADLRAYELAWFGVGSRRSRQTLQDWFQAHRSAALDVFCAIPYATFLYIVFGYTLYLFHRDRDAQRRFAWGFLLLNVAGYLTYHLYPAAPPWYFHKYGNKVILSAHPEPGPNLARVDAMLGIGYFKAFYARGSDVFGAMPSLHVSYPLLMIFEGWRLHGPLGRGLLVAFYGSMCFSAVYLDHHWVIDVVAGSMYALGVGAVMRRVIPVNGEEPAKLAIVRQSGLPLVLHRGNVRVS